jgi:hypothetical protein
LDLTDVLLVKQYECNNLAGDRHKRPTRIGPGKEGPITPTAATAPGRVCAEYKFISGRKSPFVSGTSTDGGILPKFSQDITAKAPQDPRMIASFHTVGLVPNNGGVRNQVVISVISQLN